MSTLDAEKHEDCVYALGTGAKGEQALAIQQTFMAEHSYAQLKAAKLKPGMKVYDIGCGSGEMTIYLAQQVGKTGCVYAVDASEEQINLTKKRIAALGLKNVQYILADIQIHQNWPVEKADIVYARYVLMHLPNPKDALKNMYALLKPEGMLSLQETTWSTIHSSLPCEAVGNYRDAVIALGQKKGANYNLGQVLPAICRELSFKVVRQDDIAAKLKICTAKELFFARTPELRSKIIEAEIATAEDFDGWLKAIRDLPEADDNAYVSPGNVMHILVEKTMKDVAEPI